MKKQTWLIFQMKNLFLIAIIAFSLPAFSQTGIYNQTANNIYSANSYTNVVFTQTPVYASAGTFSFQWIACHQPGFGNSTLDLDIFSTGGFQDLTNYSSGLDCIGNSVNVFINASTLQAAALAGGGNITFRFYISDGCQAGVGCAGVNDPAVLNMTLTYNYSIADFTTSDTTICPGGSITYTDITPGVTSRSWSFPGGTPSAATGPSPTVTYSSPGYHSVTLNTVSASGNNSTTKTDLIYVYTNPQAAANPSGSVIFCSGNSVQLNAATSPGWSYKWKKNGNYIAGATASIYNATTSGNYKVVVTSQEGCSSTSNTIIVTANANPTAIISANGPVTFCPGGSVTLNAFPGAGITYQWKKNNVNISGATLPGYVANANGTYTCKMTNGNGCTSISNSITISVNTPKAKLTLSGSATFCQGGSVILKANSGSGLTYQWLRNGATLTGATDSSYTATVSGNYKVIVTNNCGSSTSPIKVVTVNSLPTASISANGPTAFCTGSTVTLSANTGTGLTYAWKKNGTAISGATNANYVASTSGSYTVKVTNTNGCTSVSNAITVTVNATIASITAGGPTTFCAGDSVILTANSGTGLTYQWLKNNANISGATGISYAAKTAGTYKVIVTNTISGCPAISSGITTTVNCKQSGVTRDLVVTAAPNPFTKQVLIGFSDYRNEKISIEIISITGQQVLQCEVINPSEGFSTGNQLIPGIYMLKIRQGDIQRTLRIVKTN